jgi:hypothetical protein
LVSPPPFPHDAPNATTQANTRSHRIDIVKGVEANPQLSLNYPAQQASPPRAPPRHHKDPARSPDDPFRPVIIFSTDHLARAPVHEVTGRPRFR